MGLLWDHYFEPNLQRSIELVYGAEARSKLRMLAGLHDCGKVSPFFQFRLLDRRRPDWARALEHPGPLANSEVSSLRRMGPDVRSYLSHQSESARIIESIGGDEWTARLVEGHHGLFADWEDWDRMLPAVRGAVAAVERSEWGVHQRSVVEFVGRSLGVDLADLAIGNEDGLAGFGPTLAGWVSVADWVASDDEAIRTGYELQGLLSRVDGGEAFVSARVGYFAERLVALIGSYPGVPGSFEDVFGFPADRPLQEHIGLQEMGEVPDLALVAVPMGTGKTEAALERHRKLGGNSLYFATPTMATADAMFARVKTFFDGSGPTGAALLHGRAGVNDFYTGVSGAGDFIHGGHDVETGLQAHRWLRGRHRGLLAPVGVGTVDQALASVLRARYSTIRLAAIANTHVVFDEVHTYDPYQQGLLEALLRWLGMHRAPVTMLSATVASVSARRFCDAYLQGWHRDESLLLNDELEIKYPGTVEVLEGKPARSVGLASSDDRRVCLRYERYDADIAEVAEAEVRALRDRYPEAMIGVVLNTVDACVDISRRLESLSPLTLHARMPTALRAKREAEVLAAVGKGSEATGMVVIGTQVLEHSLDIDFDFLVTAFAPTADIIQRTGRLWRHATCVDGRWRQPDGRSWRLALGDPEVVILRPSEFTDVTCLPYMEAVVVRSWVEGFNDGELAEMAVPDDFQDMVDRSLVPFTSQSLADKAVETLLGQVAQQRKTASDRTLPLGKLWDWDGHEFLPDVTRGAIASDERATRWNDFVSEPVVLVSSDQPWTLHREPVPSDATAASRAIIEATVNLGGRTLAAAEPSLRPLEDLWATRPPRFSSAADRFLDLDTCQGLYLDEAYGLLRN